MENDPNMLQEVKKIMDTNTYNAFVAQNLADQMRSLQKPYNGKRWIPKRFEDFSNALRNVDKKHGTLMQQQKIYYTFCPHISYENTLTLK